MATSAGMVRVRRAGAGPSVVLLHSNGHSMHEFEDVFDDLSADHDVVAWDMPGHGDSDPVHPRTSIAGFADVLVEVLDALGIDAAVVAGVSVGGFIAADVGARYPSRVLAIGIVEAQLAGPSWWDSVWPGPGAVHGPAADRRRPERASPAAADEAMAARWTTDRLKAAPVPCWA